ncbi:Thiamine-monophosphate kinase [uncultured archaeon]|nr:Thiamine-monophosphate kinase [uncultured archaeon]
MPIAKGIEEMVGHTEAVDLVLRAGGDFELLFTVKPNMLEAAKKACDLTVIGSVVEEGVWIELRGERHWLEPKGYEHTIVSCEANQNTTTAELGIGNHS